MHQHDHQPTKILVTGSSGTGKTTWFLRYFRNTKACFKVLYDHEGDLQPRLKRNAATSPLQLIEQAGTGLVIYDHCRMFPGDRWAGLSFISDWTMALASKMPGRKLFAVDEMKAVVLRNTQWEFAKLLDTGRRAGLDFIGTTTRPADLTPAVRGQMTAACAFMQSEEENVKQLVKSYGFKAEEILNLPPFHFIYKDKRGINTRGKSPK